MHLNQTDSTKVDIKTILCFTIKCKYNLNYEFGITGTVHEFTDNGLKWKSETCRDQKFASREPVPGNNIVAFCRIINSSLTIKKFLIRIRLYCFIFKKCTYLFAVEFIIATKS